jgi:heme exporter protein A
MSASLWLLDEPFTNLDAAGTELVSGLLHEHVLQGGLALVVAHHDLKLDCDMRRLELNE